VPEDTGTRITRLLNQLEEQDLSDDQIRQIKEKIAFLEQRQSA
jgi:hypothetical protein